MWASQGRVKVSSLILAEPTIQRVGSPPYNHRNPRSLKIQGPNTIRANLPNKHSISTPICPENCLSNNVYAVYKIYKLCNVYALNSAESRETPQRQTEKKTSLAQRLSMIIGHRQQSFKLLPLGGAYFKPGGMYKKAPSMINKSAVARLVNSSVDALQQ